MNARQAWALLAAGVLGYEVVCKDGQLLSECVDQWLVSKPILTRAVIAALALHLGNAVPARYDVASLGFLAIRRSSRYWPRGIGSDQPPNQVRPLADLSGQGDPMPITTRGQPQLPITASRLGWLTRWTTCAGGFTAPAEPPKRSPCVQATVS
jgi:hypothetical protein